MQRGSRVGDVYPLSPLQRGLLFHAVSEPGEDPYVVQVSARVDGKIDPSRFRAAWRRLAERHAVLRTGFVTKGQREPVQVTFEGLDIPVRELDWRSLTPEEVEAARGRLLADERRRGFPLNQPPLVRLNLARTGTQAWWVLLSHHHLILDGWSQAILFNELFAFLADGGAALPATSDEAPFRDYVDWVRRQDAAAATAFWRRRLAGWEPGPVAAPARRADVSPGGVTIERTLDPRLTAAVERLARGCRVTVSTVYQAAWAMVLARYQGKGDVVFGVTVSGRTAPLAGIERMVGMLINTLPLRLRLPPGASVRAWIVAVGDEFRAAEAFAYADLAELGALAGATPVRPLFDSLIAYENFPVAADAGAEAGLRISHIRAHERTNLPLAVAVVPGTDATTIRVHADPAKLSPTTAAEMAELLASTLARLAANPDARLADVDGLPRPAHRSVQLPAGDPAETMVMRFARVAAAHPQRCAVRGPGGDLTYRELDEASDRVAAALATSVAPEDRVGLCYERCTEAIVAMLGVLKAGAAYVPIDPLYPADRIAFTLRDSGAAVALASAGMAQRLAALGVPALTLDALPGAEGVRPARRSPHPTGGSAAYVLYTSGSTGQPKGVIITQANVLRLFDGAEPLFAFGSSDVWSVFHSFAFDFSVWEIWGALLHGGRALIVPHDVSRDPAAFCRLLESEGVTVLSQTPTAFGQLIAADALAPLAGPALREVVLGGEALNPASLRTWFARHGDRSPRIVNMYGITETTVHVTFQVVTAADAATQASPIGTALPHLDILLLDDFGRPVPSGVAGEICVAGDGLARGYLGRPGSTAERFVPHPWPRRPGERLYRSGDLARRSPDGAFEYVGRSDRQVKVRGYRIELAEVEAALLAHDAVAQAAVVAYAKDPADAEASGNGLCAYVVAAAAGDDCVERLRSHLAGRLPAHLVPDAFVLLAALPLTVNGKIDLAALPDPARSRHRATGVEAPATSLERALAETWAKGLGIERVGVNENYFALGGDSLRSIRIVSLAAAAGIHVTVRQLLERPTVRSLASVAVARETEAGSALEREAPFRLLDADERRRVPEDALDAYPLARLQAGMMFHADGDGLYLDVHSFRLEMPVDEAAFRAAVGQTVRRFVALRTGFLVGVGRRPLQFVLPGAALPLLWIDTRDVPAAERERVVAEYLAAERGRPYDVARPPLARIAVHRLEEQSLQLTVSIHHAILDGWSVALWEAELLERYFAERAGLPLALEAEPPTYAQFVAKEQAAVDDPQVRAFWQARLAAAPSAVVPRWPGAPPRQPSRPERFAGDVAQRLSAQAVAAGLPLKSILLGIVGHVVCRSAGSSAVPIGLVTNGRPETGAGDRAVGLFLNTLPVTLPAAGSWRTLADAALAEEIAIASARHFPLQELLHLGGGAPPFECSFNFVHFHGFADLSARFPLRVAGGSSVEAVDIPFSFNFTLDPQDGGLAFQLLARDDVPAVQREWLSAAVGRAVCAAAATLDVAADVFAPASLAALIEGPHRARAELDLTPVHLRALAQLARRSREPVLRDQTGRIWTGSALSRLVDDAGERLCSRVARGTPVLLWLPRSPELLAAMLAVLRAGGAYVPVDPAAPLERVAGILDQLAASGMAPAILCRAADASRLPARWEAATIALDDGAAGVAAASTRAADVGPDDLAYIIFTSGSTGRPKGVLIPHGALANHMGWMAGRFPLESDDVVLQRTNPAFDAAVWELWAPLLEGALIALAPLEATRDPQALVGALGDAAATIVQMVPSLLEAMLALPHAALPQVKRLFCGGESLRADVAATARGRFAREVVNLYGPTEATIDATSAIAGEGAEQFVPIGTAVANMRAYVLNERLDLAPPGSPGELCLAGAQLAWGYAGMPGQTAERFIPDPFAADGGRLYRTGDVVYRSGDDMLHFLGRGDRQVKIGGNRLELEEVEAVIARHPAASRAAVAIEAQGGAARLVAYLAGQPDEARANALHDWLAERLPPYAIPRRFAFVADWPTLPSGKTDAAQLSARAVFARGASERATPSGPREHAMAALWADVLGHPDVGALDDFFALGGDSIVALQLAARARRAGFAVSPGDVFRHPTPRGLCRVAESGASPRERPAPLREGLEVAPVARWFFDLHLANPHHWNQALLLRVDKGISLAVVEAHCATLARRHDALRLHFHPGPAGWTMQASSPVVTVDAVDARDEAAVTACCREAQAALDLERGPLLRVRLIRYAAGDADRLLLAGHHAIVDGVSWRILLEEFGALLAGGDLGAEEPYPYTRWVAERLRQAPGAEETAFWKVESAYPLAALPRRNAAPAAEGRTCSLQRALSLETTELLRGRARERLRADVMELLLGALGAGLAPLMGECDTAVLVERHGRDVVARADVGTTVGWFTVLHPVRLRLAPDPSEGVRRAKEAIRRVPSGGAGYLTLAAAGGAPGLPEVSLNYLGQFDASFSGALRPAPEETGPASDPANRRTTLIDIVGLVADGRLRLSASYDGHVLAHESVTALLEGMQAALEHLAALTPAKALAAWEDGDLAGYGLGARSVRELVAAVPDFEAVYPASHVQRGILFESRLAEAGSGVYVQQVVADIAGALDEGRLSAAWAAVIARHEALRSFFVDGDGVLLQVVQSGAPAALRALDWSGASPGEQETRWHDLMAAERTGGFEPTRAPLSRAILVRFAADRTRLVWTHHHLIMDGWSLPIVFEDLLAAYRSTAPAPPAPTLAPLVRWRSAIDREALLAEAAAELEGLSQPALLSRVPQRPARAADVSELELPAGVVDGVGRLTRSAGVSTASAINAAFAVVLGRHLRCADVVHGVTVSGRAANVPGIELMVGLFIATVPLRTTLRGDRSIRDLLRATHARLGRLNERAPLPLGELQAKLGLGPLFDSIVVFENYPVSTAGAASGGPLDVRSVTAVEQNHYPLSLYVHPHGDRLRLAVHFDPVQVGREEAERFLTDLGSVLGAWSGETARYVGTTSLLTPGGRSALLARANGRAIVIERSVDEVIAARAQSAPEARALLAGGRTLTYGEVLQRAERIGAALRERGIGPEDRVAVMLPREADLPIALLGVMRAGAAFIPLDPTFPAARLAAIVEDASPKLVLTAPGVALDFLPPNLCTTSVAALVEEPAARGALPPGPPAPLDALAYVIFTSGSTGRPKGVAISRRAFANACAAFAREPGLTPDDVVAAVTTVSFDIALNELLLPWTAGATIAIVGRDDAANGVALAGRLAADTATVMQATPATWRLLAAAGWPGTSGLRAWCGGEALPKDLAAQLVAHTRAAWNLYGPTETTIWSTVSRLEAGEDVTAGAPIDNTSVYVVDEDGELVPPGATGQLLVGGAGVARGYAGKPALTASSFRPNGLSALPGAIAYHTGDLARWSADGRLEILGRVDRQVKINGYRVEPGEIEVALRAAPGVRDAACAVRRLSAGPALVAFVVAAERAIDREAVHRDLQKRLPAYLMPSLFVPLDALPLTSNGKTDYGALPQDGFVPHPSASTVAPRDPVEEALLSIWQEAFERTNFGIRDDFFALGGHSLLATHIHARLGRVFQGKVSLRDLFEAPTIEQLAARLRAAEVLAGAVERAAQLFLRVRRMSPQEREALRERARAGEPVGA